MESWWRRLAKALSRGAVPVDGDPGAWRMARKIPRKDTIERIVWRDVHLPPPAA